MKACFIVGQVLTCLVAWSYLPGVYGQSTCCPSENCCNNYAAPSPYNLSLAEVDIKPYAMGYNLNHGKTFNSLPFCRNSLLPLVSMQPLYTNFLPGIPMFAGADNVCFTYIPLPDGTYLLSSSTVYCNGFNSSESYIISESDVGLYQVGSSTCNLLFIVFDYFECTDCSMYLGYLIFLDGDCSLQTGNEIPAFGFSQSSSAISQGCLDTAIDRMSKAGIADQEYFITVANQPCNCNTNLNCTIST